MPRRLEPGPPATAEHLYRAQTRERYARTELERIRTAAVAWRNGLAGLLAAITGFGLIKGRSDVGQLSPLWAKGTGLLLLASLTVGALGALSLLRAAHGLPAVTPVRELEGHRSADHREALASTRALRRGIAATLACAALLVAAVAVTWYGPPRDDGSYVQVVTSSGTWCGKEVRTAAGQLRLDASGRQTTFPISEVRSITPVKRCK